MSRPRIVLTRNTNDDPVYGYDVKGMTIYAPTMSECGRFTVDPLNAYGLTPEDVAALEVINRMAGYDGTL